MSDLEIITTAVLGVVLVAAFGALYYACGRYMARAHVVVRGLARELAQVREERDRATAALERATRGHEDVLRAVRGEAPRG